MLGWAKRLLNFGGVTVQAATALPPLAEPKVKRGDLAIPSYTTRSPTSTGDQKLTENDRRVATTDLLTLRNGISTKKVVHDFSHTSPDMSAAVNAYIRTCVTRGFTAVARNLDGTANPEATDAAQQLLARFNYLGDYTDGFSGMNSIHALAEAWVKELRLYGSMAGELVLDKSLLPWRIQPISTTQIEYTDDGSGYVFPVQKLNGNEINLDVPTFFVETLDQDLLTAYSDSPMEAAIQSTLMDIEFQNDVRRIIKRSLHPRLTVTVAIDTFKKSVPADVLGDPEKLVAYQNQFLLQLQNTVNGLQPDDALVSFDMTKFDYLNNGNTSLNQEYEVLQAQIDAKVSSGTKSPGAVLGHASGSQNVASTETLLFAKYCEGVQNKLNSMFSRILTLGVRLMGQDVYVEFAFDRVDLRPESELEAFRAMKQSRVLELLSIGFMSDEEACISLTGRLPPTGAQKLSGTFFKAGASDPSAAPADAGNPLSNTAGGAREQTLTPGTPQQPKGPPVKRVK